MAEGQCMAIFCEIKQILMREISQTFSPPPHELTGRVEHYLEEAKRNYHNPSRTIAMEEGFNEYKRHLGL
jgi:hypothetical protein